MVSLLGRRRKCAECGRLKFGNTKPVRTFADGLGGPVDIHLCPACKKRAMDGAVPRARMLI